MHEEESKRLNIPEKEYFILATNSDLIRAASDEIVYISSNGNYSLLYFTNGESRIMTLQLGMIEMCLSDQLKVTGRHFVRIGRSLIINRNYIRYINIVKQELVLCDGTNNYSVSASKMALVQLKNLIEKEMLYDGQ